MLDFFTIFLLEVVYHLTHSTSWTDTEILCYGTIMRVPLNRSYLQVVLLYELARGIYALPIQDRTKRHALVRYLEKKNVCLTIIYSL